MDYFPKASLAPITKTKYNTYLIRWLSFGIPNLESLIKDSKAAIEVLQKAPIKQTDSVFHSYYSAIVAFIEHEAPEPLKEFKDEWKEIQRTNYKDRSEHYQNQEPTALQKGIELDWKEVIEVRDKLPPGIDKLLLAFYTHIPPVRADYNAVHLLKPEDPVPKGENYIILGSDYNLVLQEFKTAKTYKTIEHVLPPLLKKELEDSLKAEPRSWLFVKRETKKSSGESMTGTEFSNWANRILTRVFEKRTTLTALRHSYTSSGAIDYNGPLKEITAKAKSMGHSVSMSMGYVWKSNAL
jgi:hypothetical protein